MSVVTAILTSLNCDPSRAGINVLWGFRCVDVETLTFDQDERTITDIVLASGVEATRIEFEKNTAFLNQSKTVVKNATNIQQLITFYEAGLSYTVSNALQDLNCNCCLNIIVRLNDGTHWYCGVSYDYVRDEWQHEDMRTGEGSAVTGADPTADSAEFLETLVCNSSWYAIRLDDSLNPDLIGAAITVLIDEDGTVLTDEDGTVLIL